MTDRRSKIDILEPAAARGGGAHVTRSRRSRRTTHGLVASLLLAAPLAGCGDSASQPANLVVRDRIAALAPSANIGHRGTGLTRAGHAFPENSIASFQAAMAAGANGIELDVELTSDGGLIVMHDDTLDRTTDCSGCVSAYTLEEVQACRLLDGNGAPTDQHPPTLAETYDALPSDALVNVELKVYGDDCLTPSTGPVTLADTAVAEVSALGVLDRSFFSSFDETAAASVKQADPDAYSALLLEIGGSQDPSAGIAFSVANGLDAIHPFLLVSAEGVQQALAAGLQANVWTINTAPAMNEAIDKGVTAIITDQPGILAQVLDERRGAE